MSNVPKIRFKEFSGEWEHTPLKNIAEIIGGGTPDTAIAEYWNGNIQWFTPTEIKSKYIKGSIRTITELGLKKSSAKILPKDTLLLSSRATVGDVGIALEECTTNQGFQSLIINHQNNNEFFYNWILINKNEFIKKASGSTFLEISKKEIEKIKAYKPSKQEQEKIASFLTSVDTKIEQLTKKEELLQQYKKGVMQKIFTQKIRFKADEMRKGCIKDFGYFYYGKGAPKTSVTEDAETPCVRYGELYSTYGDLIKTIKSYTNVNPKDLKFSKGGEVLVPRVGEDPLDFANCSYLPMEGVAIGEMISVYNTQENGLYITYYFNTMLTKQFARVVEGGNVSNLYFKYLEDIELAIHSREEQDKIVDFLQALDNKLEQVTKQLTSTKEFKKALLQQMFV